MARRRRHRRGARRHRGQARAGRRVKLVTLDGTRRSAWARRARSGPRARSCSWATSTPSLDADAFDEDGYFRTGDLGTLNDDGNLIITGRLKDIIIRKGENISAKEVEDLLYTHPKIADVAVIGAARPELGRAVLRRDRQPAEGADPPTLPEMFEFCKAEGLMIQKMPEQLEIVDAMPRNPAGKVLKHDLRKAYAE